MSQAAQPLRLASTALVGKRSLTHVNPWALGLAGLATLALALRVVAADKQSAFMDESTVVLTGRMLLEQNLVYADFLTWAYCSYLWPLIAGIADELGGMQLVRGVSAACGVLMVLASAAAATRLTPASVSRERRWGVAVLAGGIMAVAPTAVAVGRFGTYDALSGAAFMIGMTLLLPRTGAARGRRSLLAAAALLFVAFLAKYLVAIYFPFVCVYVVLSAAWTAGSAGAYRRFSRALRDAVWFVLPLSAACAVYALMLLGPLRSVLSQSVQYTDLKSPDPLYEYLWARPELALLLVVAALGWRFASPHGRIVAAGGAAIMMAFQLQARADFDFWKHSIYVVYFLAPLAGLSWLAVPQNTGTWRVVALGGAGLAAVLTWSPAIREANRLIEFYPNLNPSLEAIQANVAGSALVLTDDTALRYYLYPGMATDRVFGPFFFTYRGQDGIEGYRHAIADRFFDAIVLDGGLGPQGNAIRQQLGQTIQSYYQRVYAQADRSEFNVEVYKPLRPAGVSGAESAESSWSVAYSFDAGLTGWGTHPDSADWQAGRLIESTAEQVWQEHATLRFVPTPESSIVSLRRSGQVTRLRANVYVVPVNGNTSPMRVGFIGFDNNWNWHDDGFRWVVPPGSWTTITWDLPAPAYFEELGLKFPSTAGLAYVGAFEIDP